MSVRWRHAWPVTLAIHFDPQCFDLPRNTKLPVLYTTRDLLWSNVVWILARRLRRQPGIKTILGQLDQMFGQRRRRCASIETTLAACDCPAVCVFACKGCMGSLSQRHKQYSADTRRRWINVGSTFVHHLRRWTNVKPTLIQRLVSAGLPIHMYGAYIICLSATHCSTKQTFTRCGINVGRAS